MAEYNTPVKIIAKAIDGALHVNPKALKDSVAQLNCKIQSTKGSLSEFLDEALVDNVFSVLNDRDMDANTRMAATEVLLAINTERSSRKWAIDVAARSSSLQSEFQTLARGLTSISNFDCQYAAMDLLHVHYGHLKKHTPSSAQQKSALNAALPAPVSAIFASNTTADDGDEKLAAALREANCCDPASRVRFIGVCEARIALVSPGGGGIDSICSHVVSIPLPLAKGSKKKGKSTAADMASPPVVVIDPRCLTLDIANDDDSWVPSLKVQWKSMEEPNKDNLVHYKSKTVVEIRFKTRLGHVEGLADSPAAVKAWGHKKTNSMGGASQEYDNKDSDLDKDDPFLGDKRWCELALRLTSPAQGRAAEGWIEAALDSFEEWERVGSIAPAGTKGKFSVASLGSVAALHHVAAKLDKPKETITCNKDEEEEEEEEDGDDDDDELSSGESSEDEETKKDGTKAETKTTVSSSSAVSNAPKEISKAAATPSGMPSSSAPSGSNNVEGPDDEKESDEEDEEDDAPLAFKKKSEEVLKTTQPTQLSSPLTTPVVALKKNEDDDEVNEDEGNDGSMLSQGRSQGFDLSDDEHDDDSTSTTAKNKKKVAKQSSLTSSSLSKRPPIASKQLPITSKANTKPSVGGNGKKSKIDSKNEDEGAMSSQPLSSEDEGYTEAKNSNCAGSDMSDDDIDNIPFKIGAKKKTTTGADVAKFKGKSTTISTAAGKQNQRQPELLSFSRKSKGADEPNKEKVKIDAASPQKKSLSASASALSVFSSPKSRVVAREAATAKSVSRTQMGGKGQSFKTKKTPSGVRLPKTPRHKTPVPKGKAKQNAVSRASKKQVAVLKRMLDRFGLGNSAKGKRKQKDLAVLVVESGYYDHENDQFPDKVGDWPDSEDENEGSNPEEQSDGEGDVSDESSDKESEQEVKKLGLIKAPLNKASTLNKVSALSKKSSAFDFEDSDSDDDDDNKVAFEDNDESSMLKKAKTSKPAPKVAQYNKEPSKLVRRENLNEDKHGVVEEKIAPKSHALPAKSKTYSKAGAKSAGAAPTTARVDAIKAPLPLASLDKRSSAATSSSSKAVSSSTSKNKTAPFVEVSKDTPEEVGVSGDVSEAESDAIGLTGGAPSDDDDSCNSSQDSNSSQGSNKVDSSNPVAKNPKGSSSSSSAPSNVSAKRLNFSISKPTAAPPPPTTATASAVISTARKNKHTAAPPPPTTATASAIIATATKKKHTAAPPSSTTVATSAVIATTTKKTHTPAPSTTVTTTAVIATATKKQVAAAVVTVSPKKQAARTAAAKQTKAGSKPENIDAKTKSLTIAPSAAAGFSGAKKDNKKHDSGGIKKKRARDDESDHEEGDEDEVPSPDVPRSKWPSFSPAASSSKLSDGESDDEVENEDGDNYDGGYEDESNEDDADDEELDDNHGWQSKSHLGGSKGSSGSRQKGHFGKKGGESDESDADSDDNSSDDGEGPDNTLMILMSSMAKLADEKESRQKKKLIEKSRIDDVATVEAGLATWRVHLEKNKGEKQKSITSEINDEAEKVTSIMIEVSALLEAWNSTVAEHEGNTNKRAAEFDETREEIEALEGVAAKEDGGLKKKLRMKAKQCIDEFGSQAKKGHVKKSKDREKAANVIKMQFA